jgi:glutaredoxin
MKVTIYTKNDCSFCVNAKTLLSSKGINYKEYKLNEDFTREGLLDLFPTAKTYPVIVVDGMNIGGYTELNKMLNEQKIETRKFLSEGEWNGA